LEHIRKNGHSRLVLDKILEQSKYRELMLALFLPSWVLE
jgi:hypothetical protein